MPDGLEQISAELPQPDLLGTIRSMRPERVRLKLSVAQTT
jgi:hypothetical protein